MAGCIWAAYPPVCCTPGGGHDGVSLRIEDIDTGRARAHFVDGIYKTSIGCLTWPEPVLVQSTRFETYQAALGNLRDRDLVYPRWASRAEIAAEINAMPGGRKLAARS